MKVVAFAVAVFALLLGASGAGAKEFGPGDLRVCGAERCVPVVDRETVRLLSRFYYTGPQPSVVAGPRWGAPAFEVRFRNGYATGVVASARLDRFLSFGVYLERFHRGKWYRVPTAASEELRRLTASLEPYRVTPALVARSH